MAVRTDFVVKYRSRPNTENISFAHDKHFSLFSLPCYSGSRNQP